MRNDDVLRKSLVCVAAITALTALYTHSLRKTAATYFLGMLLLCGLALPDWTFFNRPFSQWFTLLTIDHSHLHAVNHSQSRLKLYPVRVVMYSAVYGVALYKWWSFIKQE